MKHELLAPAGDLEAGYAAVYFGADAVYLGLTKFSARAGAQNFTFEELDEFTAYAHSLHRKVFVALNTILTEDEIGDLPEVFAGLRKAKVDALIVQDLGVFYLAKKMVPEIELHASTQMAVHNAEGARFLYNLGFKRVVLARELSKAEINAIAKAVPEVDLEVFVHGALCYSFSGQCLFSALEFGKSANRGRCVYPCRDIYLKSGLNHGQAGYDKCSGHIFSMKDLALEEDVTGINALSFKIEGRKKSALFVAATVNYYRHILDGVKTNDDEAADIKQIFSRPWCKFHFKGKDKTVVDREFVGHRGLLCGRVKRVAKNRLCFVTETEICRFDGVQVEVRGMEKPFGFGVKELFLKGKPVFLVQKGEEAEIELPENHPKIENGALVYLASSSKVKGKYDFQKPKPKAFMNTTSFDVRLEVAENEVWAMCGETACRAKGNFARAKEPEKVLNAVRTAFDKTGGTGILFDKIEVFNPDERFLPMSVLNELRRELVLELSLKLRDEDKPVLPALKPFCLAKGGKAERLKLIGIDLETKSEDFGEEEISGAWFVLPQICRNVRGLERVIEALYQAGARHFVAENYYGFEVLKKYRDIEMAAGSFIYVLNRYAAAALKECVGAKWGVLALESSAQNMLKVVESSPLKLAQVVRAYPPLFTSAVCVRENACAKCDRLPKVYHILRGGKEYICVSKDCMVQVFDKEPYVREEIAGVWGVINEEKTVFSDQGRVDDRQEPRAE